MHIRLPVGTTLVISQLGPAPLHGSACTVEAKGRQAMSAIGTNARNRGMLFMRLSLAAPVRGIHVAGLALSLLSL